MVSIRLPLWLRFVLLTGIVVLAIGVGLVVWKQKVGAQSTSFNSISKEEMELLLADVAKTNPMVLKKLKEDPEMKKQQLESLKELLAFASQAKHDGLADDPSNKQELLNIKAEVEALPGSVFFTRASKQEFSAFAAQYGAEDAINGIRALPRAGIVVDASRTLSTDPRWYYVNVRLLFNYVKSSLLT